MNSLTATEVLVMNNITNEHNVNVDLGDKLQEVISQVNSRVPVSGTPVNAVSASAVLTLTGVVIDGETVTIGEDVYEFLADTEQTKTATTNIAVDITANTVKATGTLTLAAQPTSGDTMTIGEKTYIFVPDGTDNADGEVTIGTSLASAKVALVAAINGTDDHNDPHPLVSAAAFSSNNCAITAFVGGTAGNSIATTETFTAETNVFGDTTLKTGANCSAANAITALVAAVTASDTEGVGAAPGAGTTIDFTADAGGTAANSITTTDTMANASFANPTMTGGVNGTVGIAGDEKFDSSYKYICVATNTVSGKNWRRVSLGSAY